MPEFVSTSSKSSPLQLLLGHLSLHFSSVRVASDAPAHGVLKGVAELLHGGSSSKTAAKTQG